MKEVWAREGEVLDATCRCRFRQQTNVNQWLFKYWQLASGNFVPLSYKFSHCYHVKDTVSDACRDILNGSHRIICINDTAKTQDFEVLARQVREAFEQRLPGKSKYEL